MRVMRWLVPLLICGVVLAACGGNAVTPVAQSEIIIPTEAPSTSLCPDNPGTEGLVARVNCLGITRAVYDREFARRSQMDSGADSQMMANFVLDTMIEQKLINSTAVVLGITVTEAEARAEIQRLKESLGSDAGWQEFLTMNGYSEDEMLNAQYDVLYTERVKQVLFAGLSGAVQQVHARHIIVRSEEEALAVLERLRNGEPFDALANEVSADLTTNERGGDLGWFTQDELIDRRLADVAFSLEPGSVAGPIATQSGFHILQVIEKAERPIEPERILLLQQNIYETWLREQYTTAQIERFMQ